MKNNKSLYVLIILMALTTLAGAFSVSAQTTPGGQNKSAFHGGMRGNRENIKPAVFGTVSVISGNIITVSGKQSFGVNAVAATYTVDATDRKSVV